MSKLSLLLPLALVPVFAACETLDPLLPPPPEELDLWADASAGIHHAGLATLARDVWEADLRRDPFHATYLGDPRWHGKIPERGLEAQSSWRMKQVSFRDRLSALESELLEREDELTAELLRQKLEDEIAHVDLELELWSVDPLEGPHLVILNVASVQPHASARQREQVVERWNGFGAYLRQAARNLERGVSSDRAASRTAVEKVLAQLDALLAVHPSQSPLCALATGGGRWVELPPDGNMAQLAHAHMGDAREQSVLLEVNRHVLEPKRIAQGSYVLVPSATDELSIAERGEFLYEVLLAVEEEIWPALRQYRDVLAKKVLPVARKDEQPGLKYVAGGAAAYRTLIREHTSLPREECDPKALHEYGLEEVARIRAEMSALGQKLFGTSDLGAIQDRLRHDPAMHFTTRAEVEAKAAEALARARGKMRGTFGILPEARCEVVPIPSYEEADSTVAYYREPAADGSRPGRYYVNTSAPETRTRYEAEALAFHEAIPGHHLQIAIAQERESLPRFRRHSGSGAFVEGWALYTERLADEMGLYSGDLDRMGMLSYDAWRASRLVVDTGLHHFGWGREEAIEYLFENTLLARNNVETEVDRYIAWPGQALAYKLGQREILALREEARRALGPAFRYPEFHDRVLENGAVTLPVLRGVIGDWLGARERDVVEARAGR
jgi:uncharacterized protein (DUF885 family)